MYGRLTAAEMTVRREELFESLGGYRKVVGLVAKGARESAVDVVVEEVALGEHVAEQCHLMNDDLDDADVCFVGVRTVLERLGTDILAAHERLHGNLIGAVFCIPGKWNNFYNFI